MLFLSGRIMFYSGIPEIEGFFSLEFNYFFYAEKFVFLFSIAVGALLLLTSFFNYGTGFYCEPTQTFLSVDLTKF